MSDVWEDTIWETSSTNVLKFATGVVFLEFFYSKTLNEFESIDLFFGRQPYVRYT